LAFNRARYSFSPIAMEPGGNWTIQVEDKMEGETITISSKSLSAIKKIIDILRLSSQ